MSLDLYIVMKTFDTTSLHLYCHYSWNILHDLYIARKNFDTRDPTHGSTNGTHIFCLLLLWQLLRTMLLTLQYSTKTNWPKPLALLPRIGQSNRKQYKGDNSQNLMWFEYVYPTPKTRTKSTKIFTIHYFCMEKVANHPYKILHHMDIF